MQLIQTVIGTPIGYIMSLCYNFIGNYGWTIIAFTLIIKLITLPIGIMVQKNSIKMVKMQPMIGELKRKYPDKRDKDLFMDEQIELFKREKYNAGLGCLPMLIQLPIIIGIIYVVYDPLKHLLGFSPETLQALQKVAKDILGIDDLGASGALAIVDLVKDNQYTAFFADVVPNHIIQSILQFDTSFLGIDLSLVPTLTTVLVIIPILSTISAFVLCLIQNKENVLQQDQSIWSKWGMTVFLVLFSLYFTFVAPAAIGIYWICSNVFAIVQLYLLNWIYNPKKYIDYEYLMASKEANQKLKVTKKLKKLEEKNFAPREREDYKRFLATTSKRLVFYSEKSGFYKYFENVINEVIEYSDITIHYVTSDPNDGIFNRDEKQIIPYYIGEKKLITLFMKMDADLVVMTMPDLDNYHIKRSLVRKDIEYIFMPHWLTSVSMVVRKGALDNFDTVFCVGPHWVKEIRATERAYGLKPKWLIECGYGVIENLTAMYQRMEVKKQEKPQILIAPSWQEDNILHSCIDQLLQSLLKRTFKIIVRPHPEYIKRFENRLKEFQEHYKNKFSEDFILQLDFSSNQTVFESDLVITDWSTIAHEFSYATKKPSLFIDTKMKVMNPEYGAIGITPTDISLRNAIGISIKVTEAGNAAEKVDELLKASEQYKEQIASIVDQYVYPLGKSGEIGAKYIFAKLNGSI